MNSATSEPSVEALEVAGSQKGVTRRVVVLCLLLAVFFGIIIPIIDRRLINTFLGAQHLPVGAVATLFVLIGTIPLVRRLGQRFVWHRNELLTVYASCLFSCIVPGHGSDTFFVPHLLGVFYFATRENRWLELWGEHLKPHLTPALGADGSINEVVVAGWYEALAPGQAIPWAAWVTPLVTWGALVAAIYVMLGCLSAMLSRQWTQHEALAFPLLKLPLEMTEAPREANGSLQRFPNLFRLPAMWIGFGIAVFIEGLNGLAVYFPDVPGVPLVLTGQFFSEPPWNQIGNVPLIVYPIVIGVTYLLTAEISFSLWFFFWFIKFQLIAAYMLGWTPAAMTNALGSQGEVFTGYQHVGAYIAYTAIVLWAAREHLGHVARRAFGRVRARPEERDEPLAYPAAFWGFMAASLFILWWCWMAGIAPLLALAMWGMYLIIVIGLSRIVVEGGLLLLESGWYPMGMIVETLGVGRWLTLAQGLVPAVWLQGIFMIDMRGNIMPSFVHSFKIAREGGIPARRLLALVAAVTIISFSTAVWMSVRLGYEHGALTFHRFYATIGPSIPPSNLDSYLRVETGDAWNVGAWTAVGALETYALMLLRARFPGFLLHPLGLLVSLTSTINAVWLSIFVGWCIKTLVTRFGGTDAYRRLIPVALGFVLGDVVMIVIWLLIDGWQGRTGHALLPT